MHEFNVIVHSQDSTVFSTLLGLVGIEGNVVLEDEGNLTNGHLGCIVIDLAHPDRTVLLDSTNDLPEGSVVAIISSNPFSSSLLRDYTRIDAFLAKPLNSEAVQAFLVGARAKIWTYGV